MNIIELAIVAQLIDHRDTAESLPADFVQSLKEYAALVRAAALEEAWDAVNKTPGAEVRCDCMNGWATVKACADAIVALKEKT